MNKDYDLQILEFYWNRLTRWQKKSLRINASYHRAKVNFTSLVFIPERRTNPAHYLNDRRAKPIRRAPLYLFLLTISTVIGTTWLIALRAPAHVAAPIIFVTILFLNIILLIKPVTRHKAWMNSSR